MRLFHYILFFLLTAVPTLPAVAAPLVKITTSMGVITLALDADKAPKTVANFVRYAREGHYNGTIFHRVIPNFMIQGGGLDATLRRKATHAPIRNEADNGLYNGVGTIAMARTSDPDSATDQFFINTHDNGFLDFRNRSPRGWGYAVFGRVVDGMDVVRRIESVPTHSVSGRRDVPRQPVTINSVEMIQPEAEVPRREASTR